MKIRKTLKTMRGALINMAFNRIGTPVDINSVDFKKADKIICSHCKGELGLKIGNMIKFAGSDAVIVNPGEFKCHLCQGLNKNS